MKKVILYIATSVDGFIARKNGSVDWLTKYNDSGEDYGYERFLDSVETVILGNTTYQEFKAPYGNKKCFVFSRTNTGRENNITFVNGNVREFIGSLDDGIGNIWLVGGAEIVKEFLKKNLIDEFIITIIPIVLGEGIPLFGEGIGEHELKIQNIRRYESGVVQLHYQS